MTSRKRFSACAGFGLIELSIVLLAISLLTGMVLFGADILRSSTQQAVISEFDRYTKSVHHFVDKYMQLPGDFNDAEAYWGADASCPNTPFNSVPKEASCNGNGDGRIGSCCYGNTHEWYRAWQHLSNAGLLDAKFSGVGGNEQAQKLLNNSVPESEHTGAGYMLIHTYHNAAVGENFVHMGRHAFLLGAPLATCDAGSTAADCLTLGAVLTPVEALEIDQKIDDGMPATGRILAHPSTSTINPDCTTGNTAAATYKLTYEDIACALIMDTNL